MAALVIQTSFLGDAVLTLPFLYRLLESGEEVVLVAAPRNMAVFERARQNGLKKWEKNLSIVSWDKSKEKGWSRLRGCRSLARELREKHSITKAYCVHRSFSSSLLALWSGARERIGFASGASSFFYTNCVQRDWDSGKSEIEKNLDLLRYDRDVLPWSPASAPSLLGEAKSRGDIVAFSLGSPWGTKEWPIDLAEISMREFLREGKEVFLLGDKNFAPKAAELEKKLESKLVKNYSGKTSLHEWFDLISQADVVVSGDSAAVHVACDMKIPVVALFGPTIPEFGFAPWRSNAKVLSIDLPCRPCDIHGPKKCPLKHHRCMRDLNPQWVVESVGEVSVDRKKFL